MVNSFYLTLLFDFAHLFLEWNELLLWKEKTLEFNAYVNRVWHGADKNKFLMILHTTFPIASKSCKGFPSKYDGACISLPGL